MFGFAIAEGIFAKQNSLFKLWECKKIHSVCFSNGRKLPEFIYRRNNYGTIIRLEGGSQPCASRSLAPRYDRAVLFQTRNFSQTKPYDIETNLPKDVILFKYENPKYFKRLNFFAISQLLFWSYLSHFVFTELKDVPVTDTKAEDLPWWRRINLGEKTHRIILTSITFLVGYSLFALSWMHTLKSVRYLVLRKGGKEVTFVTYTPFGHNRLRTVPLDKMTSKQSREAAKVQLPIKVKGDWMHYLLDMRGEFKQPKLYDFTAGLKRSI